METGETGKLGDAMPTASKQKQEIVTILLPPKMEEKNVPGETV